MPVLALRLCLCGAVLCLMSRLVSLCSFLSVALGRPPAVCEDALIRPVAPVKVSE
jgi:hypothetical protein